MTLAYVGAPRLVVDPGVYVSAAISGRGAPAQLLELAIEGQAILLISPLLLAELHEVLKRERFRRYITPEEVETYVEGIVLLGEQVDDPPEDRRP